MSKNSTRSAVLITNTTPINQTDANFCDGKRVITLFSNFFFINIELYHSLFKKKSNYYWESNSPEKSNS